MIMVSDESETRNLWEFIRFDLCWTYGTKNFLDASDVESHTLQSFFSNYKIYYSISLV